MLNKSHKVKPGASIDFEKARRTARKYKAKSGESGEIPDFEEVMGSGSNGAAESIVVERAGFAAAVGSAEAKPNGSAESVVDGAALLDELTEMIRRYVVLSPEQAIAAALWIIYSWLHTSERFATHSPILRVWAAEAESGKSTMAGLARWMVWRPLKIIEPTAAVLYRLIKRSAPTLILDEADDILANNSALRSIINGGWTRGDVVPRCAPQTHEPEWFDVFTPKLIAMKGKELPGTTASRSISIELKPKLSSEKCEHFDHLDNPQFQRLRQLIEQWTVENLAALIEVKAVLVMPEGFSNRRAENWRPLLAIAEQAGGKWPGEARAAAALIETTDRLTPAERSPGLDLLADIRDVFDQVLRQDRVTTDLLCGHLNLDRFAEERVQTYRKNGKDISKNEITRLLRIYKIKPGSVRFDNGVKRGWLREWFVETWERHGL